MAQFPRKAKSAKYAKGAKLPAAAKKRAHATPAHDPEGHICGCSVDFLESEATHDRHLPPAKGGVAKLQGARRAAA